MAANNFVTTTIKTRKTFTLWSYTGKRTERTVVSEEKTQMACEPSKLDNFCGGGGGNNWILITVLPPVLLNGSVPSLLSSDIHRYETANKKQFQIGCKI